MKDIFRKRKRKQCCTCFKTFYDPIVLYRYNCMITDRKYEDLEAIKKLKGCPHCKSTSYVVV